MNPDVVGLLSNRHNAIGWANAGYTAGTNTDIMANVEPIKFDVAPESMRVRIGLGMPGSRRETKKDISDWEVKVT